MRLGVILDADAPQLTLGPPSGVGNLSQASKLNFESLLGVGDPPLKMRSFLGVGNLNSPLKLGSLFALSRVVAGGATPWLWYSQSIVELGTTFQF